jgi:hypothetical protein
MNPAASENDGYRSVEGICEKIETSLASLNSIHSAAAKLEKNGNKHAKCGNLSDLRKISTALDELDSAHALALSELRSLVTLPFGEYLASSSYGKEIVSAAAHLGLETVTTGERRIYSPPVVAKILAEDLTIAIGKTRHRAVRPSAVATILKQARNKLNKTSNETILEAILQAYLLVNGGQIGSTHSIDELYTVLTIFPNTKREYTIDDFMAAVVAIDDTGPKQTKRGLHLRFDGDTLGKGGKGHRMTRASGMQKLYGGISFSKDPEP